MDAVNSSMLFEVALYVLKASERMLFISGCFFGSYFVFRGGLDGYC